MKKNKLQRLAISILFLLSVSPCFAHPHVFIDPKLTVDFKDSLPDKLIVDWLFDPSFSDTIFQAVGKGVKAQYTEAEQKRIEEGYFSYLVHYGYFLMIYLNDKPYLASIKDFHARPVGDRIAYRFTVPLQIPAGRGTLRVADFDATYFCEFSPLDEKMISLTGDVPSETSFNIITRATETEGWGTRRRSELDLEYDQNASQ